MGQNYSVVPDANWVRIQPALTLGGEHALDRRFQQGLPTTRQFFLRRHEFGYASIEVREQFFDLFDDAVLFNSRW